MAWARGQIKAPRFPRTRYSARLLVESGLLTSDDRFRAAEIASRPTELTAGDAWAVNALMGRAIERSARAS